MYSHSFIPELNWTPLLLLTTTMATNGVLSLYLLLLLFSTSSRVVVVYLTSRGHHLDSDINASPDYFYRLYTVHTITLADGWPDQTSKSGCTIIITGGWLLSLLLYYWKCASPVDQVNFYVYGG